MFGWGVKSVTADELADTLARRTPVLIDVREPHEFASGRVDGAVNIPLGRLVRELDRFDPEAETYVICQSGRRSARAVRLLCRAGFIRAYSVKGGVSAWRGPLVR